MPISRKIVITGSKGAGKTTLANWLLQQIQLPYDGFRTRKYEQTAMGPLFEMMEISTGEHAPISELREGRIRGISGGFDSFGVRVMQRAQAPVLLLDEIGRFERQSPEFLREIFLALDSDRIVIAVLKQEALPYIQQIKAREDVFLVDLDKTDREEARKKLAAWLGFVFDFYSHMV